MPTKKKEFKVDSDDLLKKIKEIIHEGNVRKILIKNEKGETYLEIPLNIGVVGTLVAPVWAAIGALAAIAVSFKIEVVRKEKQPAKKPVKKKATRKTTKK